MKLPKVCEVSKEKNSICKKEMGTNNNVTHMKSC